MPGGRRLEVEKSSSVIAQQQTDLGMFVKKDGTLAGAGDRAYGVTAATASEAGVPIRVVQRGFAGVKASANSVSDGDTLSPDANGKGRTSATGDFRQAVAKEDAANADDLIDAYVNVIELVPAQSAV